MTKEESDKLVNDYIDQVFTNLDSHIKDTNFIVNKKTVYNKILDPSSNIQIEDTVLDNYEDGYTKFIKVFTCYDKNNRPVSSSIICFKHDQGSGKHCIEDSTIIESGSIIFEYAKNTDVFTRYTKVVSELGIIKKTTIINIYDMDNNLIEKRTIGEKTGGEITSVIETYNNGLIEKTIEDTGSSKNITDYKYNSCGSVILKKDIRLDRTDNTTYITISTYDYDDSNKLIRKNVLKKKSDDDDKYEILCNYINTYTYYTVEGYQTCIKVNTTDSTKNKLRIYGNNSKRYIDYDIAKRRVTVMDDNIASTCITFNKGLSDVMVNYANIETDNRCLYYMNDTYNNIDNLKYIKIDENGNKYSAEYKGRTDQKTIMKIVTDIFKYNFDMDYNILFKLSKELSTIAGVHILG